MRLLPAANPLPARALPALLGGLLALSACVVARAAEPVHGAVEAFAPAADGAALQAVRAAPAQMICEQLRASHGERCRPVTALRTDTGRWDAPPDTGEARHAAEPQDHAR